MLDPAAAGLRDQVRAAFEQPIDVPLPDARFNELGLAVFAWQFRTNLPFAAFCRRRGRTPDTVNHWTDVPAVPTAAFKHVELVTGRAADAEAVFRTSGTTMGEERRGAHYLLDRSLYHGALIPSFAAYLLPDQAELVMLSLMPPPAELPDSSLAHMIGTVIDTLGAPGSRHFASVRHGIDEPAIEQVLHACAEHDRPVCLLGTSLAFLHWLEHLELRGQRFALPEGSRLMDTGGYKGRGRSIPVTEMLERYHDRIGVSPDYCVNEYGMTELCSQYYDAQLREQLIGHRPSRRLKRPPPWLRCRVVDAETLEPVPDGTAGLLQHFDLANIGSVLAVQTEDIGTAADGGVELLGRVTGAPPRGCSLAMDDLLSAITRPPHRGHQ